jgi:hypothetical protein
MPNTPDDAPDKGTPADTPDTPDTGKPDDAPPDKGDDAKDWQAEADKWKALARKHEGHAKANAGAAKELDELKASQMNEVEKAVKEAEDRGRQAGKSESGQRIAAAEIKAALKGIVADPASIVEDLNLARYVTDDGDVDAEAIEALKAKFEGLAPPKGGKPGSADGGARGKGSGNGEGPAQLSRADLKGMTPKQINEAKKAGRLRDVLAGEA